MPIQTLKRLTTIITLLLMLVFASACGQKGDLYLPYGAAAENADF
ncbi:MAG TPA: hypothetical protein DGR97_13125 [Gammaproteobacteria bacterium]|nr:hypothetical protein [Gammaproteobacteria bacterium]